MKIICLRQSVAVLQHNRLRWLHILQKDDSKWVHSVWILYIQGSRPSRPNRAGEMQWHYITLKHLLVFTSIIQ